MVDYSRSDLDFILTQIQLAEAGQAPANPHLSFGLRRVDGLDNSVVDGQGAYGSADQPFPTLTDPVFQSPSPTAFGPSQTYASTSGLVFDADPRVISNLISDQSAKNPAAVQAAAAANEQLGTGYQFVLPGPDGVLGSADDVAGNPATPPAAENGSLFINNVTPDAGLSAPFNSLFTLFGQFFDHGLDLIAKGGSGTVFVPLQPDDPLYKPGSPTNFMVLTRATNLPGPDGRLGTPDDVHSGTNLVTPFVDQNQTYTSHPSHQVFLREYMVGSDGLLHASGRLLEHVRADGSIGGEPTWADIKANALKLGIRLTDADVVNAPLLATDPYGNFISDPVTGYAQIVKSGPNGQSILASGTPDNPADTAGAVRTGHALINDIAYGASPFDDFGHALQADANAVAGGAPPAAGFYDNELLDAHFVAGDGRANENIGLTSIHEVFHDEHNRLIEQIKDLVRAELAKGDTAFASAWTLPGANLADGVDATEWNGERLFQAAKFGTETQYQHLVFEEFARKVSPAIHLFGNTNVHLDPAIVSEFANAVYRFGHSMLDENLNRYTLQGAFLDADGNATDVDTGVRNPLAGTPVLDANGNPVIDQIGLIQAFTNPLEYARMGAEAAGELTLGAAHQVGNEIDEFVTGALRNNLLGLPLDLAALNIARGRDVGVAPLNLVRNEIYSQTHDSALKPYASWIDFGHYLKHEASLVNFVAAYGEHASIEGATTAADKRAAALALVLRGADAFVASDKAFIDAVTGEATSAATSVKNGVEVANAANPAFASQADVKDASDFMHSLGAYANIGDPAARALDPRALHDASGAAPTWSTGSVTGLDHVDLWIGGLAEKQNLFGGLLGSTFDFIFRVQMENLQDGDRLYYLPRLEGTHFLSEIENNSFAEMIMHNTGVRHLSASVFLTPEYQVEAATIDPDDPSTWPVNRETGKLLLEAAWILNPDGTHAKGADGADIKSIHFLGDDNFLGNTMVLGGTEHDDHLVAGNADDDTVYGDGGDDVLDGGDGDDFIYGGDGNDTVTDTGGNDVIHGDKGDDDINAGIGDDIVFGNDGDDVVHGGKGIDDLSGGLGNDALFGDEGDDEILGNEGNDWIEGGQGGDLLNGDEGAPTGQLPLFGGDDVLIGGSWVATDAKGRPTPDAANIQSNNGGDRMQGFSGDDIMVGGGGFNKFEGRKGFDWASFEFDTQGVEVNMTRRDFILDSPPLSPDAIRDVFVETEGLSGSAFDDNLIGTNDAVADATNELTNVSLIDGLDTFFPLNAPVHFSGGNIILGGGGDDRMSGGAGNDILDGDAFLHIERQNGQILRVIRDGGSKGDIDTAVFSDDAQNYLVGLATADGRGWNGLDAEGFISVVHTPAAAPVGGGGGLAALVDDGVDKIRNIERLEFRDQTANLADLVPFAGIKVVNQLPFGSVFIDGAPVVGETLTANATLFDLDPNPSNPQLVTNLRYQWEYLDPARGEWLQITGATAQTYQVAGFTVGQPIRVVTSFTDALGFVERVAAAPTAVATTPATVNTPPFVTPQQGQVGLPDTTMPDVGQVNLFLPVTTVFGDAQTPAASLVYKVTLADGSALSTIGLSVQDQVAANGALLITGTLLASAPKTFEIRVSATDAGPGAPLTVTDTFAVNVIHPSGVQISGSLQDGYIAGATVFMDSNGNGRRESFEAQTTTDGAGHFTLIGKAGPLIATGGAGALDLATGLPFIGVMKAPAGATVITPLTNLLSEMIDAGLTPAAASQALATALGLPANADVLHADPIAGTKAGDATAQALFLVGAQVANTLALLHAGVPNGDPMTDFANLLATGLPLDLTSPAGVSALVAASGGFGVFGDQLSTLIADSNGLVRDLGGEFAADQLVAAVSAVNTVAQGSEAAALSQAFTEAAMLDVMRHFSGPGLLASVAGGGGSGSGQPAGGDQTGTGSGGSGGSGATGSGGSGSGGLTGGGQGGDSQSGGSGGSDATGSGGSGTGGSTGGGQGGDSQSGGSGGSDATGSGGSGSGGSTGGGQGGGSQAGGSGGSGATGSGGSGSGGSTGGQGGDSQSGGSGGSGATGSGGSGSGGSTGGGQGGDSQSGGSGGSDATGSGGSGAGGSAGGQGGESQSGGAGGNDATGSGGSGSGGLTGGGQGGGSQSGGSGGSGATGSGGSGTGGSTGGGQGGDSQSGGSGGSDATGSGGSGSGGSTGGGQGGDSQSGGSGGTTGGGQGGDSQSGGSGGTTGGGQGGDNQSGGSGGSGATGSGGSGSGGSTGGQGGDSQSGGSGGNDAAGSGGSGSGGSTGGQGGDGQSGGSGENDAAGSDGSGSGGSTGGQGGDSQSGGSGGSDATGSGGSGAGGSAGGQGGDSQSGGSGGSDATGSGGSGSGGSTGGQGGDSQAGGSGGSGATGSGGSGSGGSTGGQGGDSQAGGSGGSDATGSGGSGSGGSTGGQGGDSQSGGSGGSDATGSGGSGAGGSTGGQGGDGQAGGSGGAAAGDQSAGGQTGGSGGAAAGDQSAGGQTGGSGGATAGDQSAGGQTGGSGGDQSAGGQTGGTGGGATGGDQSAGGQTGGTGGDQSAGGQIGGSSGDATGGATGDQSAGGQTGGSGGATGSGAAGGAGGATSGGTTGDDPAGGHTGVSSGGEPGGGSTGGGRSSGDHTGSPGGSHHAPLAHADAFVGAAGQAFSVDAAHGVLANDADPDGDAPLSAVLVSAPSDGVFHFNADGSFSFTPQAAGTFSFTYAASDGTLTSAPATVSISVAAPAGAGGGATQEPPPSAEHPEPGGGSAHDDHHHGGGDHHHRAQQHGGHCGDETFVFRHGCDHHRDHGRHDHRDANTLDFGGMHFHLSGAEAQMLADLLSSFAHDAQANDQHQSCSNAHLDHRSIDDFRHH